jgi:hypothetical protein
MNTVSVSMRGLARRLVAWEASHPTGSDQTPYEVVQVCEKLRLSLTRFAGAEGFASLLRRGLALARTEFPSLSHITVNSDCSIDGLEALAASGDDAGIEAGVGLTAHLLELLVTFIGEPLTLRLVRESWPDA